jgi:hypothetical protein
VATTGSFLIDAETRLTSGAASTYFGGRSGPRGEHNSTTTAAHPSMTRDEDAKFQAMLGKLSREDRTAVEAQGYCAVLGNRLGSMGRPVSVVLRGQKVFLCCKGCVKTARANEETTLAKVKELKAKSAKRP